MKTNTKKESVRIFTGPGAVASNISPELALRRAVLANFLWENSAYETGVDTANNIASLVPRVPAKIVAAIAKEARDDQYLRHVPLHIVREMVKHDSHKPYVAETLTHVVQRADELSEFVSLYWREGKVPLAASVRKGLAAALKKFDEFALSRYSGESKNVKLRDVVKLVHPKPDNKKQANLWKSLIEGTLKTADTWEAELSENGNTKASWTKLLTDGKMGGLALLRNLRNIQDAGVDDTLIEQAIASNEFKKVLPFRFMTAARYAPRFQRDLEKAMLKRLNDQEKIVGKTVLIIDVSGSMNEKMSGESENSRLDIAASIAVIFREQCEDVKIYCTATRHAEITNPRRGFELCEQIKKELDSLGRGGIYLRQVTEWIDTVEKNVDRLVVITDSQDCDTSPRKGPEHSTAFGSKSNYIIDIANHKNGIAYDKFTVINGFSEKVVDFIKLYEDLLEKALTPDKVKSKVARKRAVVG